MASGSRWSRLLVGAAALVAVTAIPAPAPAPPPAEVAAAAQRVPVQGGRAVAATLRSLLGDLTVADTGDVRDPALSPVRRSVAELPGPLLRGTLAESSVVITAPGAVQARASVTDLRLELLGPTPGTAPPGTASPTSEGGEVGTAGRTLQVGEGPPPLLTVTLTEVVASSQSSCAAGSSGQTRIGSIFINDIRVTTTPLPGPNTRVGIGQLPLVSVVANEQVPVAVAGGSGLSVNAVHITVANLVDLVVSSARSEVGSCPTQDELLPPPAVEVAGGGVEGGVVRRGRVATARGSRFPPSAAVQVTFDGPDIRPVEVAAGPDGSLEVPVVVPRDARLGTRTLTAASGDRSATAPFLVVRPPAQPPTPPFGSDP